MGEFDSTIGFTLVGILLNTYFLGIVTSQFATYWNSKYKDPVWVKLGVTLLLVINMTQGIVVLYMGWFYCVANFANPSVIATSLWPYPFTALTTAVLALINQMFQCYRIYTFIPNKILAGLIIATALAACGLGIAAAVQSWIFSELAKLLALQPVVEANLALQTTVDVVISAILSFSFSRSKTDFKRTNQVLNVLIRGAVQSGVFTSIFALGTLLSFRYSPGTYMIAIFALPIGRIYTHTLLDHLIAREQLRNILNSATLFTVSNNTASESIALKHQNMARGESNMHTKVPMV
ncbi:hypothetical protein B0H10DRAFT_140210 [Mycena sp. CBHHK59/15]|nr:hypothetical protein B0H10DRAFT_510388 [Mycena sp. CBHHK59/15]KAJ6614551.1 hypothetical protein B0H10DRAFT_140210 [Mycena sp. CBHHK59/15]